MLPQSTLREDKNGKTKEAWGVTRQGGNSQEMEYLGRGKQEKEWEVGGFLVTDADVKEVEKVKEQKIRKERMWIKGRKRGFRETELWPGVSITDCPWRRLDRSDL